MKVTVKGIDDITERHSELWDIYDSMTMSDENRHRIHKLRDEDFKRRQNIAGKTIPVKKVFEHNKYTGKLEYKYYYKTCIDGEECDGYIYPEDVVSEE